MKINGLVTAISTFLPLLLSNSLTAQIERDAEDAARSEFRIDGPPPPVAPAVINRDSAGNATFRAIRLTDPIRLDGQLDEAVYQITPPLTGFLQTIPDEGEAATENTEA
ncbi:MAG TPA: hypothetical protein DIU18_06555 [Gemmatimonadetes bacterium]|nr:hypothetical protein [Gemmatimonadota bacterium]|tara:strand:- start:10053 stop:10379 length:327 start_codon:yes stop_codon:yes gene_type:complete